ncbi:MAG: AraC family transcriptional regulator [Bacteroidota bacterium]
MQADLDKIKEAQDLIQERYAEKLSISDLARAAGMCQTKFKLLYRKYTGLSPHQMIIQLRINQAACLLQESDHNISEIAFQVGYNSLSHFTALFKRIKGKSPTAYRNQMRQGC